MPRLKDCLEAVYGLEVKSPEGKLIEKSAKKYLKDGYSGKDANISAVRDYHARLLDERKAITDQISGQATKASAPEKKPEFLKPEKVLASVQGAEDKAPEATAPRTVATPEKFEPLPEGARRDQIIKKIEDTLSVPIRIGRLPSRPQGKVMGIFKPHQNVIRLRQANDIGTAFHEAGHAIQEVMGIKNENVPMEVQALMHHGNAAQEGFAEFASLFATKPEKAMEVSPEFYQTFEKALAPHTDLQELFLEARQAQKIWDASDPIQKVASFISSGTEAKKKGFLRRNLGVTMNQVYTALKDDLWPIKKLEDFAKEHGTELTADKSPYVLARLLRGWPRIAEQYLKIGTFQRDPNGTIIPTGPPLVKILAGTERAGERPLLDAYRLAKRAVADERVSSGFSQSLSLDDFEQTVKELEPKHGEVAKYLENYSNQLLRYLVKSGRISQESYETIKANNLSYAPLHRLFTEQDHLVSGDFAGKSLANVTNPVKKLKGSGRQVISPTENDMRNTFTMINAAERNRVGAALVDMIQKTPGLGMMVEQIPPRMLPKTISKDDFLKLLRKWGEPEQMTSIETAERITEKSISDVAAEGKTPSEKVVGIALEALKSRGWSDGEARQIIERLKGAETEEAKKEIIEKTVEKTVIMTIKQELGFENMPDKLVASFFPSYQPGPGDAVFYKSGKPYIIHFGDPELLKAFDSASAGDVNFITKFLSLPAKWLRAGATTYSAEFAVRNPLRDQWTAFCQSQYGYVPGIDLVKGMMHILKEDPIYQEYNASGAAHAAIVSMDRDYISKNLEELLKEQNSKLPHALKNPLAMIQDLSELFEEATRVGEFARAIKKEGYTPEGMARAGLEARNVTLDFSRQGQSAARSLNRIAAFWNARLEGIDRFVSAHKNNFLKAFIKGVLSATIPAFIEWWSQKDDPIWQELPEWRKAAAFNIVVSHNKDALINVVSVPRGFEWGVVYGYLFQSALDAMYRKDPRKMAEALQQTATSFDFAPIPTAALPVVEWWANKSFFFNSPIVPPDMQQVKPMLQYKPTTSETSKLIAKMMDALPGLNQIASPAKLDNLIYGLTGGAGKMVTAGIDYGLEKTGLATPTPLPEKKVMELPGFRAFTARFPNADSKSLQRFYDDYQQKLTERESMKEEQGMRGIGAKGINPLYSAMVDMTPENVAYTVISALRKNSKMILEDKNMDPATKRQKLDSIYIDMTNTARAFYKLPLLKME